MQRSLLQKIIFALVFASPAFAFATTYTPGQTLDPSCTPSDSTCLVVNTNLSLATTTSATSGVISLGGVPFLHEYGPATSYARDFNENLFVGANAGNFNISTVAGQPWFGSYNTGLGTSALNSLVNGFSNTAIGGHTLQNLTGGFANLAIGLSAGNTLVSGSNNILIAGDVPASTTSNMLNIGNKLYGNLSTGNIGIGTTTPAYKLDVTGNGHFTSLVDAANFVATSTTATSTFAGGFNVANGGLLYDRSSGSVGIGTTTPSAGATLFIGNKAATPLGTISVTSASGAVIGTGTTFVSTFMTGDTIIANGETHLITAIASDTSLTTDNWTSTFNGAYTSGVNRPIQFLQNGMLRMGNNPLSFSNNNLFDFGNIATNTSQQMILVRANAVNTSATTNFFNIGINGQAGILNANTSNWTSSTGVVGVFGQASGGGSGTVTNVTGVQSSVNNFGPGTSTNAIGFRFSSNPGGTGPITNVMGLAIPALSRGTNNTSVLLGTLTAPIGNYGIYQTDTYNNYFAGNVGIGTTSPGYLLDVNGTGHFTSLVDAANFVATSTTATSTFAGGFSIGGSQFVVQQATGRIGIGTVAPIYPLQVKGSVSSLNALFTTSDLALGSAGSALAIKSGTSTGNTYFTIQSYSAGLISTSNVALNPEGGSIGIGTTTPTAQLSTTGTVRFSNFGAGTLTTDASGNLSVSSDERLKNIDGSFTRGLSDIMKLSPISYHWNQLSGLDTTTSYSGFSAQNVRSAIPEAVGTTNNNGYLTLQDRPILAATVNAIKDIGSIGGVFKDNLIAWLGNSANGITSIFATRGHFSNELCVGDTCVTPEQFKAMVAASQQSAGIGSTPAPAQVNPPQQDATTTTIDTTDTESTSTPQADSSTTE